MSVIDSLPLHELYEGIYQLLTKGKPTKPCQGCKRDKLSNTKYCYDCEQEHQRIRRANKEGRTLICDACGIEIRQVGDFRRRKCENCQVPRVVYLKNYVRKSRRREAFIDQAI